MPASTTSEKSATPPPHSDSKDLSGAGNINASSTDAPNLLAQSPREAADMANPELPNELWIEIFSHLDYFDLKSLQRVNKNFNALTQLRTFDVALWRPPRDTKMTTPPNPAGCYKHPALHWGPAVLHPEDGSQYCSCTGREILLWTMKFLLIHPPTSDSWSMDCDQMKSKPLIILIVRRPTRSAIYIG